MDIAGPFPVTERGNKYILVTMVYFTKWLEVYTIPKQETSSIAKVVVENMFMRFGVLIELHTDQGRAFESAVFSKILELTRIKKTRIIFFHVQSVGMVDRVNKTFEKHFYEVIDKGQRDWDNHYPLFLIAYRAAVHETTGFTPPRLIFGREIRLSCDLMFGSASDQERDTTDYAEELRNQLTEMHETARHRINLASDKLKARYDRFANSSGYKEKDKIWLYNSTRKKGISQKLSSKWEGKELMMSFIKFNVILRAR